MYFSPRSIDLKANRSVTVPKRLRPDDRLTMFISPRRIEECFGVANGIEMHTALAGRGFTSVWEIRTLRRDIADRVRYAMRFELVNRCETIVSYRVAEVGLILRHWRRFSRFFPRSFVLSQAMYRQRPPTGGHEMGITLSCGAVR